MTKLIALLAGLALFAAVSVNSASAVSAPVKVKPKVDVCDVFWTKKGPVVLRSNFTTKMGPLAKRPQCGEVYVVYLSSCRWHDEAMTWAYLAYHRLTGQFFYVPC